MNVRIFGITEKATLQVLPETALSASWQQDADNRWIDVEAAMGNGISPKTICMTPVNPSRSTGVFGQKAASRLTPIFVSARMTAPTS